MKWLYILKIYTNYYIYDKTLIEKDIETYLQNSRIRDCLNFKIVTIKHMNDLSNVTSGGYLGQLNKKMWKKLCKLAKTKIE